jgi:hypothetical protein
LQRNLQRDSRGAYFRWEGLGLRDSVFLFPLNPPRFSQLARSQLALFLGLLLGRCWILLRHFTKIIPKCSTACKACFLTVGIWREAGLHNLQAAGTAKRSASRTRHRILWVGKSSSAASDRQLGPKSASPIYCNHACFSRRAVSTFRSSVRSPSYTGIDCIGWHSFRHTFRSLLDETGAPIKVLVLPQSILSVHPQASWPLSFSAYRTLGL